jgi:hypothetical protein
MKYTFPYGEFRLIAVFGRLGVAPAALIHREIVTCRITTFRSTTDRIYDGGKNFWKLYISWLWRKITCQNKSSIWTKLHSMTFARRRNRLTTLFSERIPVIKRRMTVYRSTQWTRRWYGQASDPWLPPAPANHCKVYRCNADVIFWY